MMNELAPSAQRVQDALRAAGVDAQVRHMPDSTRTAEEAAASVGCTVAQIAKSLVFRGKTTGEPVLVIASGINRVDEKKVGALIGEPIERAPAELVREATGFAIGGVPPIGHARPLRTIIDQDLLQLASIWAAAGTPNAVFPITAAELVRVTGGTVADVRK
jgi:prolyl-tRNA editing enzyme YbaK/EbsC (Cys-tRNA(Pro) deacylase)